MPRFNYEQNADLGVAADAEEPELREGDRVGGLPLTIPNPPADEGDILVYEPTPDSESANWEVVSPTMGLVGIQDSDDIPEGSANLYFTEERAEDTIAAALVGGQNIQIDYDDLGDTITIEAPGSVLTEEDTQDAVFQNVLSGQQQLIEVIYDDPNGEVDYLVEPDLSLYDNTEGWTSYDSTDFDNDFSDKDTDDLPEGGLNVYFTDERAQDAVANALVGGQNVAVSYDDLNNDLTVSAPDAEVQDAVFGGVLSGPQDLISVTYDDANNEVSYDVESDLGLYNNTEGWTSYDSTDFDTDFSGKDTDDLSEGSANLYFTDSRVFSASQVQLVGGTNLNIQEDATNETLTFNASGAALAIEDDGVQVTSNATTLNYQPLIDVADAGGGQMNISLNDTVMVEGENVSLLTLDIDSDDVPEGTGNLYFTDSRVFSANQSQLVGGTGISITEDTTNETFTFATTGNSFLEVLDNGTSISGDTSSIDFLNLIDVADPGGDDNLEVSLDSSIMLEGENVSLLTLDINTDDISEGTGNLYFTDQRAVDAVEAAASLSLQDVTVNGTLTDSSGNEFMVGTGTFNDDQVPFFDASNMRFAGSSDLTFTGTLLDLNTDADFGGNLFVGNGLDVVGASSFSDTVTFSDDVTFNGGIIGVNSDQIAEGTTNLYFTGQRAVDAIEAEPVLNLNEVDVSNSSTFQQDLTIQGDLTVNGTEFISDTATVEVQDNTIILNKGETAAGVSAGTSGIEVDRGSLEPFVAVFDDSSDVFEVGTFFTEIAYSNLSGTFQFNEDISGGTSGAIATIFEDTGSLLRLKNKLGSFTPGETITGQTSGATATADSISEVSDLEPLAVREESPEDQAVAFWNAANERLETNSSFNFNGTQLEVPDLNVTGSVSGVDSDQITEGAANLYFTESRVFAANQSQLVAGAGIDILEDTVNETFTFVTTGNSSLGVSDSGSLISSDAASIDFLNLIDVTDPGGDDNLEVSLDSSIMVEGENVSLLNIDINSDDITEGTSNLYFTESRVFTAGQSQLVGGSGVDITEDASAETFTFSTTGNSGLQVQNNGTTLTADATELDFGSLLNASEPNGDEVLVSLDSTVMTEGENVSLLNIDITTDDLSEGTGNLYFTDERAQDAALGAVTGQQGIVWSYQDGNDLTTVTLSDLNSFTTDDLSEGGGNLYFTENRVFSANQSQLVGGDEIEVVKDATADTFTFNVTGNSSLEILDDGTSVVADAASINFQSLINVTGSGDVSLDSTVMTEGENVSLLNIDITSDSIPEGSSNLYFTDQRVFDANSSQLAGGSGVSIVEDSTTNTFTINNIQDPAIGVRDSGTVVNSTAKSLDFLNLVNVTDPGSDGNLEVSLDSSIMVEGEDLSLLNIDITSDAITEGTTNLYFTDQRAVDAVEAKPVLNLQEIDVANSSSFQQDLTVQGDLTVNGTQFVSNTETVQTQDNKIILNDGETGAGVGFGNAGIEIDRGSLEPFAFLFTESDDEFKLGSFFTEVGYSGLTGAFQINEVVEGQTSGASGTVFEDTGSVLRLKSKTGSFSNNEQIQGQTSGATANVDSATIVSDVRPAMLREDLPTDNAVTFWDSTNKIVETDGSFTFDGTEVTVPDINVTGTLSGVTTDDLPEGSNNLYFTDVRALDAIETAADVNLTGNLDVSGSIESDTGDASGGNSYSIALGNNSTASAADALAFGPGTTASGGQSTAFGDGTTASNFRAFAIGNLTEANGISSFAQGENSIANGTSAAAFGNSTEASGAASISAGEGTIAGTQNSLSVGQFNSSNQTNDGTLFAIGNGASGARSDALVVGDTGSLTISGPFQLPTGTSVNNIKTSVTGTSDDAVLTEGAVVAEINSQAGTSNPDTVTQGTNLTLSDSDSNTVFIVTTSITVTLPTGLSEGFNAVFINEGGGTVTFNTSAGTTLNAPFGGNTLEIENAQAPLVADGSDNFYLGGQLGA